MRRYVFNFWNRSAFREETVVIVGSHYDDAEVAAWTVLGTLTLERTPRMSWRLVSTMQQPVWAWMREQQEVAS